jgi:hypothetical protein
LSEEIILRCANPCDRQNYCARYHTQAHDISLLTIFFSIAVQ